MGNVVDRLVEREYAYGFHTELETERAPKGLSEDVVRFISAKKGEPDWLLEWRLAAFRHFQTLTEPAWPNVRYPPIDYQGMYYWAAPKPKGPALKSLDEVDPEIRAAFDKLGISLAEQERLSGVAVSSSVPFRRPCASTPTWYVAISDRSCRCGTTSSPRSTRRCSPTVRSVSCPPGSAARWNCRPTSASTPPERASSSGR
jgi:hypothetical protein